MKATRTTPSSRRVLILYASQTGTAEDLSLQLSATLERHRFTVTTLPCDALTPFSSLAAHDLVFLLISTTGQGEVPDNAKTFWRNLLRKKIPPGWLGGVNFGVFCLGDSTYPKFCWAGRKVGRRLLQLGANEVVGRGEGDGSGDEGIEGAFGYWVDEVRNVLRSRWPLLGGLQEIPEDVVLPSKWVLTFADPGEGAAAVGEEAVDGVEIMQNLHAPRPGSVLATVKMNERITPKDHWQDVRHFTFALPKSVDWEPGDTVSVSPKNFPEDVDLFLQLQNWTFIADRPLKLTPAAHMLPDEIPPCPISTPISPLTLRTLLIHHLDITAIPRRSFFSLAAALTTDETHKERLAEFAEPQWVEELWDYTTRPRRSLLEVLQEFNTVRIGLDRLLELVPRLRERQFSIASSSLVSNTTVDLLVAIVKYRTIIKKTRQGVCTRWLASLVPEESSVNLLFQKGSLALRTQDLQKPVVMVGPGTGVAPMRALLWHRVVLAEEEKGGENLLFFGCRNREKDNFFSSEWEQLENQGVLQRFTAFSRDQKAKRYVQAVIREQGKVVWEALGRREGTVFVCGSSGRMPQAVREALVEVFGKWGCMGREDAKVYLEGMEKIGRYKQETW